MINNTLTVLTVSLAITSGVLTYALKLQVEETTKANTKLEISTMTVNALVNSTIELGAKQATSDARALHLTNKYASAKRELDSHRDREDIVLKKKSLVALKINKAFQKSQGKLACITGDTSSCGNQ